MGVPPAAEAVVRALPVRVVPMKWMCENCYQNEHTRNETADAVLRALPVRVVPVRHAKHVREIIKARMDGQ